MKHNRILLASTVFLLLSWFGMPGTVHAQGNDCRMKRSEIVPIIGRFNPFVTDHSWDDRNKTEIARLDANRLLVIKQKACLRHHILFTLYLDPSAVGDDNKFWVTEVLVMMKKVYFDKMDYLSYKREFEVEFIKNFLSGGTNRMFNFPVNERTFICKIEKGSWGAKIKLEVVKLIIRENIKLPGISRQEDDGWFKGN